MTEQTQTEITGEMVQAAILKLIKKDAAEIARRQQRGRGR